MSTGRLPYDDQLLDALAQHASSGLDDAAERALLGGSAAADADAFDRAAAALSEVFAATDGTYEDMPESLRDACVRAIEREAGPIGAVPAPTGMSAPLPIRIGENTARTSSGPWAIGGWIAAAACLLLAVAAWWPTGSTPTNPLTPTQLYDQLAAKPGVVKTSWVGLDDVGLTESPHALDDELAGEVIWDAETQTGYMKFTGLASNDPTEFQYQLWIFDASRQTGELPRFAIEGFPDLLTQRPVDGGVFDAAAGEIIIPIHAKLPVGQAAIFAITKEPPGGVVVSDRDIVTLALAP